MDQLTAFHCCGENLMNASISNSEPHEFGMNAPDAGSRREEISCSHMTIVSVDG